jgi:hypothetical protein
MTTAYALEQVMFGLLGLLVAWYALGVMDQWPTVTPRLDGGSKAAIGAVHVPLWMYGKDGRGDWSLYRSL